MSLKHLSAIKQVSHKPLTLQIIHKTPLIPGKLPIHSITKIEAIFQKVKVGGYAKVVT